jgi:murein L,D-transpeptidase YcbB/YkuD
MVIKVGHKYYFIYALISIVLWASQVKAQTFNEQDVTNSIRLMLEKMSSSNFKIREEPVLNSTAVQEIYLSRSLKLIWNYEQAENFIKELKLAPLHGLNQKDYHLPALDYYQNMQPDSLRLKPRVEKDILLTDAFLIYCMHMVAGKVNQVSLAPNWIVNKESVDYLALLNKYTETNNHQLFFDDLAPKFKSYDRLKKYLKFYRDIADKGGWGIVDRGESLKKGMVDRRVEQLRNRLAFTDSLSLRSDTIDLFVFDADLEKTVMNFQRRQGIDADGVVGKTTLDALNVSVNQRIASIIINLERCRWLPRYLGDRYIMVNLPAFELEVVVNSVLKYEMDVAVGKPFRKTPVFSSTMTYMVFNPYWVVPPSILYQDMIPAQIKNGNYLKSLNIKVLDAAGTTIDPSTIIWTNYQKSGFPYTLRQEPGKNNALGEVKFIFPNKYNIYMHDTNHRELFAKSDRALSSGCIRLSKPIELANLILSDDKNWTSERINQILKSDQNFTVVLSKPYQVHLQYWTTFVDEKANLNFRKDIYDRDLVIGKSLNSYW